MKPKTPILKSLNKDDKEYLYRQLWMIFELIEDRELTEAKDIIINLINKIK